MVELILGGIGLVRQLIAASQLNEEDAAKVNDALDTLGAERKAAVSRWDSLAPKPPEAPPQLD